MGDTSGKSNAAPPRLELPTGGGAIRGIGEKFAFNAVTGTASVSVPLAVANTRGGFGPKLELSYNSGSGNGVFGSGWHLSAPSISRKTDRGLPRYFDDENSDTFILASAEDLVPLDGGSQVRADGYVVQRFLPRVEGEFARIEWWKHRDNEDRNHWRVITGENVTHLFGLGVNSRVADPNDPTRIFQWLLATSFDAKGNAIVYGYRSEDALGADRTKLSEAHRADNARFCNRHLGYVAYGNRTPFYPVDQSYLESVAAVLLSAEKTESTDWLFRIVLDYGEHPDATNDRFYSRDWLARKDSFSSYRAGFEIRTNRLCRRILFLTRVSADADGIEAGYTGLTQALELDYDESDILTKLTSIRQVHFRLPEAGETAGDGKYCRAPWPALDLEYSTALAPNLAFVPHDDAINIPAGVDGARFEWLDLDGEAVQGVLSREGGVWSYAPNRWSESGPDTTGVPETPVTVGGAFRSLRPIASNPNAGMGRENVRLLDLEGDGSLDLVQFGNGGAQVYQRSGDGGWYSPSIVTDQPAFDVNDPNLRFIDLDGDGKADLLLSDMECFLWQESLGKDGFGAVHRIAKMLDERMGPRCIFQETIQTIFLADMSGDGLTDIVRIRNGDVAFWPNLGYGKFGPKVTMDGAPLFDRPNEFDPARIRLVDVDGSGISDIVYLSSSGTSYWANLSGNGWSERRKIPFPVAHTLSSVSSVDFYGRGTGCLVWSSSGPGDQGSQFFVIDLTGGVKPHLLTGIRNNIGAETRLSYRSSTQFYLEDLANCRPWLTRLPFPVHTVSRVETLDGVSGNRFVSSYSYHHGFYDAIEREFRGFGLVEQIDSERIEVLSDGSGQGQNFDRSSYVPPVVIKTWYHLGAWRPEKSLISAFEDEYWKDDALAPLLEDASIPDGLTVQEEREACRSLRGRVLRRETYALDSRFEAGNRRPYEVFEQNYSIRMLQRLGKNQHAVFLAHTRETVQAHYERAQVPDPRVKHDLTLKVDDFGDVEQSVSVAYGRRVPDDSLSQPQQDCQARTRLIFTLASFTNHVEKEHSWRVPLPAETRSFELSGQSWSSARWAIKAGAGRIAGSQESRIEFDVLTRQMADWQSIPEIEYAAEPNWGLVFQRRLTEHVQVQYRRDDLKGLLAVGVLEGNALEGETLKLATTPALADLYSDRVSSEQIFEILRDPASGYREQFADSRFWVPAGRIYHAPDVDGVPRDPASELAFARQHFYQPHKFEDPFGQVTHVAYDDNALRMIKVVDPVGNVTSADYDYRVLQPKLLTDANENSTAVAFDTRGLVVGTAILGKNPDGEFGDTLFDFKVDLTATELQAFAINPVSRGPKLLGKATTRIVYDVLGFLPERQGKAAKPIFAATLGRELHVRDLPDHDYPLQDHIQCKFSYSDGFGREIQQKVRTASGPVERGDVAVTSPRWIGTGWTIYNNKGAPVRQYEPYFSVVHDFEFGRMEGVSPILFYDPVGRVVATLLPDHSWEKVIFDSWKTTAYDRNDTVLIDPLADLDVDDFFKRLPPSEWPLIGTASPTWYKIRTTPPELLKLWPGNDDTAKWHRKKEAEAAQGASDHANTPTTQHFDTLGHEFLTVTFNRFVDPRSGSSVEQLASTTTLFDIQGHRRSVTDALGRVVMSWHYDMLGHPIREASMDAGRRWMLPDASTQASRRWDERGHAFRDLYDAARRPIEHWVTEPAEQATDLPKEICYEKIVYGESSPDAVNENLRGRVWKHYDPAGLVTNRRYDSNGNPLIVARQFAASYRSTPDWSTNPHVDAEEFITTTEFDALNRPTAITTPDSNGSRGGSETLPRYNISGQLEAVTLIADKQRTMRPIKREPHYIVRAIEYDAKGQRRTIQFGNDAGGEGLRTVLSYDARTFRLVKLVTINKGNTAAHQNLDYAYDPIGNITAINDAAQQTFYFKNQVANPSTDYTYDANYRLLTATGREHVGQNIPPNAWDKHRAGSFNASCEFSGFANPGDAQAMRNYAQSYAYDLVGNIEEMIHRAGSNGSWRRRYSYEMAQGSRAKKSNRLVSTTVGGAMSTYSYDAHGSMISMPHLPRMEIDFRDQLSLTQRQDIKCAPDRPSSRAEQTYYVYDAGGERVRKVTERNGRRISERLYIGLAETYRGYDGSGDNVDFERQTVHVSEGNRRFAIVESRIRGSDKSPPDSMSNDTQQQVIRCQFPNHLDSACLEVEFDPKAKIISYEEFHPFGTTSYLATGSTIVPAAKRYRFIGKERDEESGLNYHSARYLATWLGRWISADPSGLKDGVNRFCYARLNPVVFSDPGGHASWGRVAGIATAIVVGAAVTALTGGLGAGLVVAAIAGGALGSAAGTVVESKLEGHAVSYQEVAISAALGGAAGLLGAGVAKGASFLAGTAPARAAATFVAQSSVGRAVTGAIEAAGSTAPARAAARVLQTFETGLQKVESLGKLARAAVTSSREAMSSGEKEVLGAATGAANRLSAEVLESAAPRAESALSASKLRAELTGREIAGGHAFEKHVLENGEFKGLEIRTREQFARHIESVVDRPDAIRELGAGRTAYYNDASSTVVIKNPKALDGGTAFQPRDARSYFERLR